MCGFVCDCVTEYGEIIEVQTGSFAPLKEKVRLLTDAVVKDVDEKPILRIVHPVVVHKNIELFDSSGKLLRRRKSPRSGTKWDIFKSLVHAPELARAPCVAIEIALVDITEKRIRDGRGSWRRKGVSIADRILTTRYESITLTGKADYCQFAPFEQEERFTAVELSARSGIRPSLARQTLFVLLNMGVVTRVGKKGRAWEYSI
jgi:hypothetical protein